MASRRTTRTTILRICSFIGIWTLLIADVSAGNVSVPNTFQSNTTASANAVNDNFTELEIEVNDNAERILSGNPISNGSFLNGLSGWTRDTTLSTGTLVLSSDATAPAGANVVHNSTNGMVWGTSETWIPIDKTRTYQIRGSFKRQAVGSAGAVYLAVRLRDASGAEITGDGDWWFYPVANASLAEDVWTSFSAQFGAGTDRAFPAEAREATVAFVLNIDSGNVAGNRVFLAQGFGIFDATPKTAWTNLALQVSARGGEFQYPQYRRVGDKVCLRGALSGGLNNSTNIATLPSGFRPPATIEFTVATQNVREAYFIRIRNNGIITTVCDDYNGCGFSFLDGICFSTSP